MTDRVARIKIQYRDTPREICTSRYKIITQFYRDHPEMNGLMKRALYFKEVCENIAIRIGDSEVIVGNQSGKYAACAIYPENGIDWMVDECKSGLISTRETDKYLVSEEDRAFIIETGPFWHNQTASAQGRAYVADSWSSFAGNGLNAMGKYDRNNGPIGHFCTGYDRAIRKGIGTIGREAADKVRQMEDVGVSGNQAKKYFFYKSVAIVCQAMVTLTKRHAALAQEMYEKETKAERKAELGRMVEALNWCIDKPARNFHEALQALHMYQTCLCLDANMHGISIGRVDQYLGDFYDRDIANGTLTPEYGQELLDMFYLKIAEMNKPWSAMGSLAGPGYTSGQLMTLGGVKADGSDASNSVTYMMLQSACRLELHDPPQALRVHNGTPKKLWTAAIETTKKCGGVPSFQSDEAIIPVLVEKRGMSLEDARNYCLIGCVEPGGCGNDWPGFGSPGVIMMNLPAGLWLAMNNGINPMPSFEMGAPMQSSDAPPKNPQTGLPTGYLYEMTSFEQLLDAYKKQIEFFSKWCMTNNNLHEAIMSQTLANPVASCTMDGCMETGTDVMEGGAKYNNTGICAVGIGNAADSLNIIKYLCFDEKLCTTRELYDALMANWEGYEKLRSLVKNECPHYGNGIETSDQWITWISDVYADAISALTSAYCRFTPGVYPVTTNVMFGMMTAATPDGRKKGEPLADGISPVQQMDTNGPTGVLVSVARMNQSKYASGTLLNMKFHPTALNGADGVEKLTNLLKTYLFEMGGMEVQINVVTAETLIDAQRHPDQYKNLVVRVAGFSTYFVELHAMSQNDLISRTQLMI